MSAMSTTCTTQSGPDVRKYYGKYPGLVVENEPEEGDAQRGDILVEVPGILEEDPGATDGPSSNGGPGAGSGERPIRVIARPCFPTGFYFVPEKDQQVWVEFAAGDINAPLWTGVWYPADRAPKTVDDEAPTPAQKLIRTPSGQVVQLEDTEDGERLVLTDEKNTNRITLDQDGIRIEGAGNTITLSEDGIELEDANGNTIAMTSSSLTLERGLRKLELSDEAVKSTDMTGALQGMVLTPYLDQWVKTHQHTGNMGAPTPLFPASTALLDGMKQFFTSGT